MTNAAYLDIFMLSRTESVGATGPITMAVLEPRLVKADRQYAGSSSNMRWLKIRTSAPNRNMSEASNGRKTTKASMARWSRVCLDICCRARQTVYAKKLRPSDTRESGLWRARSKSMYIWSSI